MPQQQQEIKEVVFDEMGNTVAGDLEPDPIADAAREAAAAGGQPDSETEEVPAAEAPKYRIGDQEFATQEAALAYAQRQVEVDNAYQQGVREAAQNFQRPNSDVTPAAVVPDPGLNTEELYTNPQAFLDKFAQKIKADALNDITSRDNMKAQSDAIWREFTERHPALADFRSDVEQFVQGDQQYVRSIIQTKGRPASYDYIATKLKAKFEAYGAALKPRRELPNSGAGASPSTKGSNVTLKADAKKPLSFSEQVRSIRKAR